MAPKVGIVGAGPSGLTLARILLHKYQIGCTIYERDTDRHQKVQGGSLDLHDDGGLKAIRDAGLWDDFQKHARYEGQDFILQDRYGNRAVEEITPEGQVHDENQRPEIDRIELRDILLDSIPQDIVQWGKNVRGVEKGTVHLEDKAISGFDLIIGADGAWSKVRPLLTSIKPFYAGITGIEMKFREVDTKNPDISKAVGRGSNFALGEETGQALFFQRNGDGSLKSYAFMSKPENWSKDCGIDFKDINAVRKLILEEFKDWASDLTNLIKRCDDDVRVWPLYMLPPGLRWPSKSRLTVIGDGAHLMTPFAGEGVNSSMWDAMVLAHEIGENPSNLDKAIANYEQKMFQNAKEKTTETFQNMMNSFNKGGIQAMLDMMGGPPGEEGPQS